MENPFLDIPITETSNYLSEDIDMMSAEKISEALFLCEKQIFDGYENYDSIYSEEILTKCTTLINLIKEELAKAKSHEKVYVFLIGAGTSGRLSHFIAKVFDGQTFEKFKIVAINAGGIKSLIRSQPNAEDDYHLGISDFTKTLNRYQPNHWISIGISCGLSANYVRGALHKSLRSHQLSDAIIGFNPVSHSKIDLKLREGENRQLNVINPIIGPEAIIGSVRMKGGTATLILLYTILRCATKANKTSNEYMRECLDRFRMLLKEVSTYTKEISQIIEFVRRSLISNASINLWATRDIGALCVYDAAECLPTFGIRPNQINAYTESGLSDLVIADEEINSHEIENISSENFLKMRITKLTVEDLIIVIGEIKEIDRIKKTMELKLIKSKIIFLIWRDTISEDECNKFISENMEYHEIICFSIKCKNNFEKSVCIRSILSQISSGAFILAGKVYKNKMIDLRITNRKLLNRAIRIISELAAVTHEIAFENLCNIVYESKTTAINPLELDNLIELAASTEQVVPLSILHIVFPEKKISEIRKMISDQQILRKIIKNSI